MEEFKELSMSIFFIGIPLVWAISCAVAVYKEKNRHSEITKTIMFFMNQIKDEHNILTEAIRSLSRQKSLVVFEDEEGNLSVKTLDTAGKEEVRRELRKQAEERSARSEQQNS